MALHFLKDHLAVYNKREGNKSPKKSIKDGTTVCNLK